MNHCHQPKSNLDYIIFWSSIITFLVLSHKANGILTDSNDLHCTHVQCPTKCPEDSYLKSILDIEEDDFEDYEEGFISHFEELPPVMEVHEEHPEHTVKERQKREVFFQDRDIEKCCDNQKCVCNKCQDLPKCFEGYVAVEIHEGQGVPGNCCSQYRCVKKEECQVGVKQSWWTSKCTKCSCFGENELCMQICPEEEIIQNCYSEYWQKPMLNGAVWKEGSCTSCTCEQGERRCLTPVCPKLDCKHIVTYEDECCPKCVDDETDERIEIVHNQDEEEDEIAEEYTNETIIISKNDELNSSFALENSATEIVELDDGFTMSPLAETAQNTSAISSVEDISSSPATLEAESTISDTTTSTESLITSLTSTVTPLASVKNVSQESEYESSTIISSTLGEDKQIELDTTTNSVTASTTTEEPNFSFISRTTEINVPTRISEVDEDTTTQNSIETSTNTNKVFPISSTSTLPMSTTPSMDTTSFNNVSTDSSSIAPIPTIEIESTTSASTTAHNRLSTEITTSRTTTAKMILSSETPVSTTETPTDYITTKTSLSISTSSTTSSPFSSTMETLSLTPNKKLLKEISTISTTTAPELIQPLYQLYGDFNSDQRVNTSTQNQMRIMFDEIDYVVMIALFIGSLTCIALGLILRHAKNRKKMYSSIPNSETSLSQTSTVLTV